MEQNYEQSRPVNPRRRKKTQMEIFKEAYLPVIIAGVAIVMILVFIIGSITRGVQRKNLAKQEQIDASIAQEEEYLRLTQEAQQLLVEADALASTYDYAGAINRLNQFSGPMEEFPNLTAALNTYTDAQNKMEVWAYPSQVVNLSFQMLIADPSRAYSHEVYGDSFNRNFITTSEFYAILQQLYNNGYVLVSTDDVFATQTNDDGTTTYTANTLYLPEGKKPLMLTQTNVNYNYYLIDSDYDKIPDANGGGFASKLILDADGFSCEMVDAYGQTVTGDYDFVPLLENFIKEHPDFSYRGARAVLALTGYNGLFGYRTHAGAAEQFGQESYDADVAQASAVAAKLVETGYELAFYTYENIPYGESGLAEIQADMNAWNQEAVPIIGQLDTIVYAQMSDISTESEYSGEVYEFLKSQGLKHYIGFCDGSTPWAVMTDDYTRQGRIMVTGATLAHHADWFEGMFDAASLLDSTRGEVPEW